MPSIVNIGPMLRGLVILYTSTLLAGMWAMILPTVPIISSSFGITPGTAAQVVTALAVGRFIGLPVSGTILDRLGTRTALIVGPAAACIAALGAATVPWFSLMLAFILLIGAADSIWVIAREVAGIDLARQDQRGRVLSGFHGVNNIGLALGPLLGGVLTQSLGFRAVFFGYAAGAAAAAILGLSVKDSRSVHIRTNVPDGIAGWGASAQLQRLRALRDLFHQIRPDWRATYAVLVFATFTSFLHRVTAQSMLPLYGSSHLGLSPKEIGLLFSISGMAVFVMILPAGLVIDKVGRKWATVPSTGIPALAFILIPFSQSFFQLAVLMSFLGIANGLSLGSLATSTYDVVPPAARGRLQAARRTIAETGAIGAPLLGGLLADKFDPGVPFLAYAPLLVLSAFLLATVGRETLNR